VRRTRGFTLVELMVYLALLVAGTIVIASLEFTAARAAFLERSLVDLGMEGDEISTRFRDDVRQSVRAEDALDPKKGGAFLVLTEPARVIRWEVESPTHIEKAGPMTRLDKGRLVRKVFEKGATTPSRTQAFVHFDRLVLTRSGAELRLELTLAVSRGGEVTARRTYAVSAAPVAEEAP
jgi:hypothetical protein